MESDDNKNQKPIMDEHMSVSRIAGYAMYSGPVTQTRPEVIGTPAIQYPIDDTMPVKAWVFELQPAAQDPFKPLRPEVERKAIEAINRHLPSWDQIEIPQRFHTGAELVLHSRHQHYPETYLTIPRTWDDNIRDRSEAAKHRKLPKPRKPAQDAGRETPRGAVSMNWTEMEDEKDEDAWTAGGQNKARENKALVIAAPDLTVTRPDGETRRLQHRNLYVRGNEGGRGEYIW